MVMSTKKKICLSVCGVITLILIILATLIAIFFKLPTVSIESYKMVPGSFSVKQESPFSIGGQIDINYKVVNPNFLGITLTKIHTDVIWKTKTGKTPVVGALDSVKDTYFAADATSNENLLLTIAYDPKLPHDPVVADLITNCASSDTGKVKMQLAFSLTFKAGAINVPIPKFNYDAELPCPFSSGSIPNSATL